MQSHSSVMSRLVSPSPCMVCQVGYSRGGFASWLAAIHSRHWLRQGPVLTLWSQQRAKPARRVAWYQCRQSLHTLHRARCGHTFLRLARS